jgi:hypothetical protein
MKVRHTERMLFLIMMFFLQVAVGSAQLSQSTPTWLGWLAFYDSLTFYSRQSPGQDARILRDQFKLSPTQAETVLKSGKSFMQEIQDVDSYATTEIKKRYRHMPAQTGRPAAGAPRERPATPQKSIPERARADGLLAEVETKKQSALTRHLERLRLDLGQGNYDRIRLHIETAIVPRIKHLEATELSGTGQPTPLSPAERAR